MFRRPSRYIRYLLARYLLRRKLLLARSTLCELRLWVRTEDVIGRRLYKYGVYEEDWSRYLLGYLTLGPNDVAFDVGANIGWYTLLLDRLAADGAEVYAFEPDPVNCSLLARNVKLNAARSARLVPLALADTPGERTLYLYPDKNRGKHSLLPLHEGEQIAVQTTTLDRFWQEQALGARVPCFIKIDIEGYELFALRGARAVLARCPLLLLEYSPEYMRRAGLDPGELLALLEAHGYLPHRLGANGLIRVGYADLAASAQQENLLWQRPTSPA